MSTECETSASSQGQELKDIKRYAFDVWHRRPKPDTSYQSDYQRLRKWPEASSLQLDNDVHYRHRPQPTKYFLHTRQFPLPSQRNEPVVPPKMPAVGGGTNGLHPSQCHMKSAARTLSCLQWRRTSDDYQATAALVSNLKEIPHVDVRRTESFTHADMHRWNPRRGDFSIHPDWPPTLPHHRIPYLRE